jgi:hypothetical protein
MINNKVMVLSLALAAVIGVGSFGSVSAYQGDYTKKGPNFTTERHIAITKAFQDNDYDAWKNLMPSRGRVVQLVNEDNFSEFVRAHNLALEGKYDEANTIREDLGLRTGDGKRAGVGFGQTQGQGRGQKNNCTNQ